MSQQPPPQGYGQWPPQGGPPPGGQQQQYQYPPQQQYPPQGQQYYPPPGAPPPQGGYQQPPPSQYPPQQGYYPPQGGYAPPQGQQQPYYPPQQQQPPQGYLPNQAPYGAPPPGQYQQQPYYPPPGQQQQFPPPGQAPYGAPVGLAPGQPSPGYTPGQRAMNYNPNFDIEVIRKATKGFNTDEKALIKVFVKLDPLQIESLNLDYYTQTQHSLVKHLEDKTRGSFEDALCLICRGPLGADAWLLNNALAGLGTKESFLDFTLLLRSNADIRQIKTAYEKMFQKSLDSALRSDLSGKTERMYMMVIAGTRQEDNVPVNPQEVKADVAKLHTATEGKMGTDEVQVCSILTNRNDNNLRAICAEFERTYHIPLEKVITNEFSGHMRQALLYIVRGVQNKAKRDAELIEGTMAGMGTRDLELAARIVQAHWNRGYIDQIKVEYQKLYKTDLVKRIKGETSSDFERILVAMCE